MALTYVKACQRYDGSFAQAPGLEGHAGSTFCALSTFAICHQLNLVEDLDVTMSWLAHRLIQPSKHSNSPSPDELDDNNANEDFKLEKRSIGYQGRVNKDRDACYSFWVGASLQVKFFVNKKYLCRLKFHFQIINPSVALHLNSQAIDFVCECQDVIMSGFAKTPADFPGMFRFTLIQGHQ